MSKKKSEVWDVPGCRVVVKQDPVAITSKQGIILDTPEQQRRRQAGQTVGTLVGIGSVAFTGPDYGPSDRDKYQIGTRVLYRRYGGDTFAENPDDPNSPVYHVLHDSCVLMPYSSDLKLTQIH